MTHLPGDLSTRPEPADRAPWSWGWFLGPVVLFVLAGCLTGVVWERLATPGRAIVMEGKAYPAVAGVETLFDQVGTFVLLTGGVGLVLGLLLSLLGRVHASATSAGVLLGSLVGAPMAYLVGRALGPGAPNPAGHQDYDSLPMRLSLRGIETQSPLFPLPDSTLLVMALTAMLAVVVVHLFLTLTERTPHPQAPLRPVPAAVGWPPDGLPGESGRS